MERNMQYLIQRREKSKHAHILSFGQRYTFLNFQKTTTKDKYDKVQDLFNVIERLNFGLADLQSVAVFDLPSPSMSS